MPPGRCNPKTGETDYLFLPEVFKTEGANSREVVLRALGRMVIHLIYRWVGAKLFELKTGVP